MNAKHNKRRRLAKIRKAANPDTAANFAAAVRNLADRVKAKYIDVQINPLGGVTWSKHGGKWEILGQKESRRKNQFCAYIADNRLGHFYGQSAADCLAQIEAKLAEIPFPEATVGVDFAAPGSKDESVLVIAQKVGEDEIGVVGIVNQTARQTGKTAALEAIAAEAGVPVIRQGDRPVTDDFDLFL